MINIAELLKGCPKDTEFYTPLGGKCRFSGIDSSNVIRVLVGEIPLRFDQYGRYVSTHDAECLLFPSKYCRTWEGWKLPVEPKFKVGDWIAYDDGSFTWSIKSVRDKNYYFYQGGSLPIKDIDEHYHLWSIADAKDGDVLATNNIICVFKKLDKDCYYIISHCIYTVKDGLEVIDDEDDSIGSYGFKPATKEDRDLLFRKMKEAGYEWDAKKKELRKIKPHYDIANFHTGMPVLVRNGDCSEWRYVTFSHYREEGTFCACGSYWYQCIPFEGNEHMLGTTKPCSEKYINW